MKRQIIFTHVDAAFHQLYFLSVVQKTKRVVFFLRHNV